MKYLVIVIIILIIIGIVGSQQKWFTFRQFNNKNRITPGSSNAKPKSKKMICFCKGVGFVTYSPASDFSDCTEMCNEYRSF